VKAFEMQLRPSARLLATVGAVVLATALSSCGFGYATDRVYTPGNGVNDRDAKVDVLNAVIVSAQEGSGTFIASFSNNEVDTSATVDSLAGAGDDSKLVVGDFDPIEIAPGALVNLATDGGIPVTGELEAGNFVSVTITFSSGETATLDVPAVNDCGPYEGLDTSASSDADSSATPDDQCGETGAPEQE
jgi:hypothetical protein